MRRIFWVGAKGKVGRSVPMIVYNVTKDNVWITTVNMRTRVRTDYSVPPGAGIELMVVGLKQRRKKKCGTQTRTRRAKRTV